MRAKFRGVTVTTRRWTYSAGPAFESVLNAGLRRTALQCIQRVARFRLPAAIHKLEKANNDQRNITCCGQHVCNMAERNGASVFLMGVLLLGSMIFTGTVVFHFRMK